MMGVFTPQKWANAANQPLYIWLLPQRAGLPPHRWVEPSILFAVRCQEINLGPDALLPVISKLLLIAPRKLPSQTNVKPRIPRVGAQFPALKDVKSVSCCLALIGGHAAPKYPELGRKWVTQSPRQPSKGPFSPHNMMGFSS